MSHLAAKVASTFVAAAAGAMLALIAVPVVGQAPPSVPRLATGRPDLNGVWQALNEANFDIQMHAARPAMALRAGPTVKSRLRPCWRLARSGPCRPASASSRAARFRTGPDALEDRSKRTSENWLTPRSGDQVLSAGRAARHLHAVSVSDRSERERRSSSRTSMPGAVRNIYMKDPGPRPWTPGWGSRSAAGRATRWSST